MNQSNEKNTDGSTLNDTEHVSPLSGKRMDQMTRNSCVIKRMGILEPGYRSKYGGLVTCLINLDRSTS